MSLSDQPQEHECYGNPCVSLFANAVRAKVEWAIASSSDIDSLSLSVRNGGYSKYLEDPAIEAMLYPEVKKPKLAEETFQGLTELVAIWAFRSDGVTMFGYHFEVDGDELIITKVFIDVERDTSGRPIQSANRPVPSRI